MWPRRAFIVHPLDNVATVLEEVQADDDVAGTIGNKTIALRAGEKISFGFKIALAEIPKGEVIRKYGKPIGRAAVTISKGMMVHLHNLEGIRGRGDLARREGQ